MKKGLYFLLPVLLVACGGAEDAEETDIDDSTVQETVIEDTLVPEDPFIENPPMEVTPLAEWPNEIEECSCGLSFGKAEYERQEYIYADDLMEFAYMVVDGERIQFTAVTHPDENGEDQIGNMWNSENYTVRLDIKSEPHDGETEGTYQTGALVLQHILSGVERKVPVYGFCGC